MRDYKDRIQARADQLAFERYEKDFYDLPEAQRDAIYTEANRDVIESMTSAADYSSE